MADTWKINGDHLAAPERKKPAPEMRNPLMKPAEAKRLKEMQDMVEDATTQARRQAVAMTEVIHMKVSPIAKWALTERAESLGLNLTNFLRFIVMHYDDIPERIQARVDELAREARHAAIAESRKRKPYVPEEDEGQ